MSRTPWQGTTRRFAGVIALALVRPILPIGMRAAGALTPPRTSAFISKARFRNTANHTHCLHSAAKAVAVS